MHGQLPADLEVFVGVVNGFTGSIPVSLEWTKVGNYLNGSVPETIGKLEYMESLYLNGNAFSVKIPFSIYNLTRLTTLNLVENRLEGRIPPELEKCINLTRITERGSLSLASNSLTGSLPIELGQLINLEELDVSHNKFSGEISSTLSNCLHLERVNISNNHFQGTIPQFFTNLKGLDEIDFSRNILIGKIPEFLGKIPYIRKVNLSFNELEAAKHLDSRVWIAVTVPVALIALVLCSCGAYYRLRYSRKAHPWIDGQLAQIPKTIYREIFRATDGFSDDKLVGSGSFGSVYKAHFHSEDIIMAVKVLNLQQRGTLRRFLDECRALRNTRHRNLLRIKTACSSIDHQGNDFKVLVFLFMTNGNLHNWMHPENKDQQHQTKKLGFIQSLNIAIDVASALDYLHNHCQTQIVHCDLKRSNILLDEDMCAMLVTLG
ncbi:hypothetical protein BC332_26148 [Capsicum chinense]|nr:hypothetical protein BC332_26148 [Capsicum chinense]